MEDAQVPNESFKPTPHRGANHMADTACHVLHAPLQRGLTLVLGLALLLWRQGERPRRERVSRGAPLRLIPAVNAGVAEQAQIGFVELAA